MCIWLESERSAYYIMVFPAHWFYIILTQLCAYIKIGCESERRLKEMIVDYLVPSAVTYFHLDPDIFLSCHLHTQQTALSNIILVFSDPVD